MLESMFDLQLPVLEKLLRPILVYLFLVVAFRLAGKRELGGMHAFDFVVILTVANVLQNAGIGDDTTVTGGVIGAVSLLITNYLVVRYVFKHPRLEQMIEGEPAVLVQDGQILADACRRQSISQPELLAAIRRQGIDDLSDVAVAILETGGTISVIPKRPTAEERAEQAVQSALARLEAAVARIEAAERA